MSYIKAVSLCVALLLAHHAAIAQDLGEANDPSREELDANFGPDEYKAMAERYSDVVPEISAMTPSRLASAAELVVVGTVTEMYYTHEGDYDEPFTHTRVSISRVVKGDHPEKELTITQRGGPSLDRQEVTMFSHTEYFRSGEDVVLFLVTEQGQWHVMTRYNVEGGLVYNADGYGITMSETGSIGLTTERNTALRFSTIDVGVDVLIKNFSDPNEGDADYADGAPVEARISSAQLPVDIDVFLTAAEAR